MVRVSCKVLLSTVVAVGLVIALIAGTWAVPAAADWREPVDAPVVDPFRPPKHRFGAGNRGLEYGTVGGEQVRAVDTGRVVFAGRVGRHRHIVVDHGDGLRSTSAYMASVDVVRGQRVSAGQLLGTAAAGFHLTARLGDTYVDPALLFAGAEVGVRLVPGDLPALPPRAPAPFDDHGPSFADSLWTVVAAAVDLSPAAQFAALAQAVDAWHHEECSPGPSAAGGEGRPTATAPPDLERVLVQVGGLGSSSDDSAIASLDTAALGYVPQDVVGFSYGGGCTPQPPGRLSAPGDLTSTLAAEGLASSYAPADTLGDVRTAANDLADLIESVASHRPGHSIDIAAHSLGGVIARLAVEELARRNPGDLHVDLVVTIGSPHAGADLASAVVAAGDSWLVDLAEEAPPWATPNLLDAPAIAQLAENGEHRLPPPGPPPPGVDVLSIGASTDLVVAADKTIWAGATNVLVDTPVVGAADVHGVLPGLAAVTDAYGHAIAGTPPPCRSLAEILVAASEGRAVAAASDVATVASGLAGWLS